MKRLNINISNILPTRKAWLGVGLLLALASCTDLNEQLYDKVSQDDYGKTSSEVATIVGGAYATLRGYGSGTPEGAGIICYPTCEYVFFTQECSSDEHVYQPVVQTGMMAVAISSSNATTGTLRTLVFSLFGDITSLVFLR